MSVFEQLNRINVNDHTERKNGLTYLSWAWAWAEVKKLYPDARYTIYERETEYGPVNYFTDGRTCWVKTGVEIEGLEHIEELPVMDFKNRSIAYADVTSMDINKAIQRSLTKACARHGLGLYIYAGEDLPEDEEQQKEQRQTATPRPEAHAKITTATTVPKPYDHKPELNSLMQRMNTDINGFAAMYAALIEGGIVPNLKSSDMGEAEWKRVFRAIEQNFLGDEAAS